MFIALITPTQEVSLLLKDQATVERVTMSLLIDILSLILKYFDRCEMAIFLFFGNIFRKDPTIILFLLMMQPYHLVY